MQTLTVTIELNWLFGILYVVAEYELTYHFFFVYFQLYIPVSTREQWRPVDWTIALPNFGTRTSHGRRPTVLWLIL